MRVAIALCLAIAAGPAWAESLVAARLIRAMTVIVPEDVAMVQAPHPGAMTDPALALGQEARVTLYPGRPIRAQDLGPPAVVDRNQIVPLTFRMGALTIRAEGRALSRGAAGDLIRVLNLASRNTVTGLVRPDGSVAVGTYE